MICSETLKTMKRAWSRLPIALIGVAAILHLNAAASTVDAASVAWTGLSATSAGADWLHIGDWIAESYGRAPTLMLVLAALLVLPPLALAGLMLRWQRRSPEATVIISRPGLRRTKAPRHVTQRTGISAWPTEAWIEVDGARHVVGRTMLRIGREADNDIQLADKTVHRYHAVVRRSIEGDVLITDLSGSDGNGVLLNGARVAEARLKPGDAVAVGEVKMKFDAKPV